MYASGAVLKICFRDPQDTKTLIIYLFTTHYLFIKMDDKFGKSRSVSSCASSGHGTVLLLFTRMRRDGG